MLFQYRSDLNNLLQNPAAATTLYPTASIDRWINIARGQVAGEGECIRVIGTVQTVIGQRTISFNSINIGTPSATGIQGIFHVRRINLVVASGERWLKPRAWEWFNLFYLNNVVPAVGPPINWAQYGQGATNTGLPGLGSGSFYLDPIPDQVYTLNCDCVCYPITLVDDTTKEAIPYMWTDAVPFFAAYYAFLSSQTSARQADAERMYKHYQTFQERARKTANPSVLRTQYEQAGDPVQMNKIGMSSAAGGGQ